MNSWLKCFQTTNEANLIAFTPLQESFSSQFHKGEIYSLMLFTIQISVYQQAIPEKQQFISQLNESQWQLLVDTQSKKHGPGDEFVVCDKVDTVSDLKTEGAGGLSAQPAINHCCPFKLNQTFFFPVQHLFHFLPPQKICPLFLGYFKTIF